MDEARLGEMLISSIVGAGGVGSIVWYFIKRLITRIDRLEDAITGKDGLESQLAVNMANDKAFVKRFEDHISTHKGIKTEVQEILKEFELRMDQKYKLK